MAPKHSSTHTSRSAPPRLTPAFLALAVAAVAGCGGGTPSAAGQSGTTQRRAAPVPVVVASVTRQDVAVQLRAIGTVEPVSTVTLRSQVEGIVAQVHFEEGQTVARGTPEPRRCACHVAGFVRASQASFPIPKPTASTRER